MLHNRDVEILLARVAMGDRAAFQSLYECTAGVLLATAARVLQDRTAAEDVVQDVFAGLWSKASDMATPSAKNLGWLCVVTRNRALDHLRKRPRETSLHEQGEDGEDCVHDAASEDPGVFEQLAFSQDQQRLRGCLKNLEGEPRQAVLLCYFEGLTHMELAERLKRPLGTVKAWTRRSLMALKTCMEAAV
jgi:RNA polymerase sigma-70 factor (ECF subfamily)